MDKVKKYEEAIIDFLNAYAKEMYSKYLLAFHPKDMRQYTGFAVA